jgi:hypothetical protein
MQHDAELSSLNDCRLPRAIMGALLISVPLWGGIGGIVWLLQVVA